MNDDDAATGPHAEQIRYWNEIAGPIWTRYDAQLDAQLQAFGRAAMDRAGVGPGARVLDVGCGAGSTTIELGRRVLPGGRVTGVDLSDPMLELARAKAAEAGVSNATFVQADASSADLGDGSFDRVYSRFGVMFFADPTAAFARLRAALGPSGRLTFACWRGAEHNPWMRIPLMAVAQHVTITPPEPGAPGPLAFADERRVRGILEGAGFSDVAFEAFDHMMHVGGTKSLDEAADFLMHVGPAARALREVEPERAAAAKAAIREAIAPHHGPDGLRLGGSVWIVTANR